MCRTGGIARPAGKRSGTWGLGHLELTLTRRRLHWSQPLRDLVWARRGGMATARKLTRRRRAGKEKAESHVAW